MFTDDRLDSFIHAAKSSTVPPTAYLALPSVHSDVATTLGERHLSTSAPQESYRATKYSYLSIRIPGVINRLSLRRVGSCSVSRQTEEEEVVVDRATQNCGLIPGLVDCL